MKFDIFKKHKDDYSKFNNYSDLTELYCKDADELIKSLFVEATLSSTGSLCELEDDDVKLFNMAVQSWETLKEITKASSRISDDRQTEIVNRLDKLERELGYIENKIDRLLSKK